jgi:F-type H+-transporting ATPase subunit delta
MAESATIARPYARAAFEAAGAAGAMPAWSEALARASAAVADARVAELIGNPRVRGGDLVQLLAEIAGAGSNEPILNFLRLLTENRRIALLPEIAAQYERMRADAENTVDVTVVSAMPLTPEQSDRLTAALGRRLNTRIRLHAQVDPRLIGGAIVRAGDFVTDGSLRGRLERLAIGLASA